MPSELLSHRRKRLFRERVILTRTETSIKCGREHLGWGGCRYCGFNCPTTLAGILDETAILRKLGIFDQRHRGQIKQPRRDYRSATPYFCYLRQIQVVALLFGNFFRARIAEDVEAFGIRLHEAVFDSVVD